MRSYGRVGWVGSGLVARLGRRLANAPDIGHTLIADVLSAPLTLDDVVPWIRFEGDRYVRVSVLAHERFEIRLLCWAPGQSSALHAHGDAWCGFRVLTGVATEGRLGAPDRELRPGAVNLIRGTEVHQVANRGPTALVTLHVYAPPLPVDAPSGPNGRRIVVVGGGFCGSALAVHLLGTGRPDLRITLVDRGPGVGDFLLDALADAIRTQPGRLRIVRDAAVAVRGAPEDRRRVVLGDGTELPADEIVLALGDAPTLGLSTIDDPLLADRMAAGELVADTSRLGVPTDADGRAIGADGASVPDLWVLGGARRPPSWDGPTVPELGAQARDLAAVLADRAERVRTNLSLSMTLGER